jgi:CheY-like chemotaxis protein
VTQLRHKDERLPEHDNLPGKTTLPHHCTARLTPYDRVRTMAAVKHILVVDDDALVLAVVERALPEYRVTVAPDGDTALTLASQLGTIDLVITDYLMPSMTGDEVIGRLRELRPGLKALVMTGHGDILSRDDPDWWKLPAGSCQTVPDSGPTGGCSSSNGGVGSVHHATSENCVISSMKPETGGAIVSLSTRKVFRCLRPCFRSAVARR